MLYMFYFPRTHAVRFYFSLSPTQERICLGLCCVVGKESVVPNPEQCIMDYCLVRPMYV